MSKKHGLFAQTFATFGRHQRACLTGIGAGVLVQVLFAVLGVCRPDLPDWMQVIWDGVGSALPFLPQLLYWGARFVVTAAVSTLISLLMLHNIFTEEFADAMGTGDWFWLHSRQIAVLLLWNTILMLFTVLFVGYYIETGWYQEYLSKGILVLLGPGIWFAVSVLPQKIAKLAAVQLERLLVKPTLQDSNPLYIAYLIVLLAVTAALLFTLELGVWGHLLIGSACAVLDVLFHLAWYRMILPEEYLE